MRPIAYLAAALGAALITAAPAFAGTATMSGSTARFDASPGETNRLSVDARSTGVMFSDYNGAVVVAGAGCTQSDGQAWCAGAADAEVALGDLADELTIASSSTLPVRADGGPGNDVLNDGPGPDELAGGPGDDWLVADDGESAPDTLTGGPGDDLAIYSQRFEPLQITLDDVANDGQAGEGDNVHADIEAVDGGYKNDTLTGSAGDDDLNGGGGGDTL